MTQADPGGWAASKVLRVPGSFNYKRNERGGDLLFNRGTDISDMMLRDLVNYGDQAKRMPSGEEAPGVVSSSDHLELLQSWWDTLPLSMRSQLKARRARDRSLTLYQLAGDMHALGLPPEDIFQLLAHTSFNKFVSRPDALWKLIHDAKG